MMDWAEEQAIVGVIFGGIQKAGTALNIPFDDFMEWIGYAQDIENQNKLVNKQCVEVVSAFQKDGFETCILKGQGNAMMYPNPQLRMPGDIDVWVLGHTELTDITDNTDREKNTFASQGHTLKERTPHSQRENLTNDTNRKTNTDHTDSTDNNGALCSKLTKEIIRYVRMKNPGAKACYHHVEYGDYNDVEVEVHYRPSFMNNLIKKRRLQRWFMVNSERVMVDLPEGTGKIPVPTWEFNVVFQLCHIYNHLIHEGIGIRQMLDYYYLLKANTFASQGHTLKERTPHSQRENCTNYTNSQGNSLTSDFRHQPSELLKHLGLLEIAGTVMWVLGYLVHGEQFTGHDCRREEWMICEPDERRGRFLLEEIMEGGNFGMGLKSSKGWLSANTAIGRNILRLKRDARLLRYFPSECLWEPIFRLWHFGWRLAH